MKPGGKLELHLCSRTIGEATMRHSARWCGMTRRPFAYDAGYDHEGDHRSLRYCCAERHLRAVSGDHATTGQPSNTAR